MEGENIGNSSRKWKIRRLILGAVDFSDGEIIEGLG